MFRGKVSVLCTAFSAWAFLISCSTREAAKDYDRKLPPGAPVLRKVNGTGLMPDIAAAWNSADVTLRKALNRSSAWMEAPSTSERFPKAGISYERAKKSLQVWKDLLENSVSAESFERAFLDKFDVYMSVGCDRRGTVFYTGYFSPVFTASRQRTEEYRYPIYSLPPEIEIEPVTGEVLGYRVGGRLAPCPARREIRESGLLEGRELLWLKDRVDAYIIQVNGSAKLMLRDGSPVYVGYAGSNGREYTSVGKLLVKDNRLAPDEVSYPSIRRLFQENPALAERYIEKNDRFVFFKEYSGHSWPSGSLGLKVTPFRSLATDKEIFPAGCGVIVETKVSDSRGGKRKFQQFMLDQDTGGAIRAAGRADIYMGVGKGAGIMAGRQSEEGKLYYFFLKPEYL